jgi:hypothetical protein
MAPSKLSPITLPPDFSFFVQKYDRASGQSNFSQIDKNDVKEQMPL